MHLSADDRLAIHELVSLHGHLADDRRDQDLHLLLTGDDGGRRVAVRSKGLAVMDDGTTSTVIYEDVVVRTEAGWRIARRTVVPARTG